MPVVAPASDSARKLDGGFDANLDFPLDDPSWAQFAGPHHCSVTSYSDLDVLTMALRQQLFDFSYLPSASFYFLRDAPYRAIVSALTGHAHQPMQNSVLIVSAQSPAKSWNDLRGKRLGYINTFCTTSYFAPSILLSRDGVALKTFFEAFPVAPWQGQIDAVIDGGIDATMVYEEVWLARPGNAESTKIIGRLDGLPTPPFIVNTEVDAAACAELKQALLGIASRDGPGVLYAGFTDYQDAPMQQLFAEIAVLPGLARAA